MFPLVQEMSLWKKFKEERKTSSSRVTIHPNEDTTSSSLECDLFLNELSQLNPRSYSIRGSISDVLYFENAFSQSSENSLLRLIDYEGEHSKAWRQLKTRRLQCWGGMPDDDKNIPGSGGEIPSWLHAICTSFVQNGFFPADRPPNHVLINEYQPGQGIMHHTDGPKYLDRVVILSLCSGTVMSFRPRLSSDEIGTLPGDLSDNRGMSIFLQPRSLLYFTNDAYNQFLHGIEARSYDQIDEVENIYNPPGESVIYRAKRISFTIRHIFRESVA